MVWTRGKDGRKKTTTCSPARACERRKKQRKTKEEMNGWTTLQKISKRDTYNYLQHMEKSGIEKFGEI